MRRFEQKEKQELLKTAVVSFLYEIKEKSPYLATRALLNIREENEKGEQLIQDHVQKTKDRVRRLVGECDVDEWLTPQAYKVFIKNNKRFF